jgi:Fe(3+) dicitrate transport protein
MKILRFTVICFFLVIITSSHTFAQEKLQNNTKNPETDIIPVNELQEVIVNTKLRDSIQYLHEVKGVYVFVGKKTHIVIPNSTQANLAQNNVRQSFAKVPGVTTWDMDGEGTQLNIGSRGVDSHRSIEMNMRPNAYVTNSDIFGYLENHYTLPLEAVQEIQFVRGSAALQYGSQYGGMMNFIIKQGDSTKPIAVESIQTAGSNGFFNSYNAVGGTVGKINYYAYYDNRHGNGWRPSQEFDYQADYANIEYRFNDNGSIALQFSRMNYVEQIAGGLTDAQFAQNPRQLLRNRNFFHPEINIPAIIFKYAYSPNSELQVISNALFGQRNSVHYINTPNIPDTVNLQLGTDNPRQVDRDYYRSFSTKARLLHTYQIGKTTNSLAAGFRLSSEVTRCDQLGVGTTGSNFDLSLVAPYGTVLRFHNNNAAVFAENVFQITPKFSITPGFRYELIQSDYTGLISHATVPVAYNGNRSFPLFGTGLQYQLTKLLLLMSVFSIQSLLAQPTQTHTIVW